LSRRRRSAAERAGERPLPEEGRQAWAVRLAKGIALWAIPCALLWMLLTPFLNLFLARAAERMTRLTERPAVTTIQLSAGQDALVNRTDTRARGRLPYVVRVTDIHFPLILVAALFLATPGIPWKERASNLGLALLVVLCFDVVDLFFWVKFVYATQLGSWSLEHYGAFARNFWGLGKHLLDLPVKLALPIALWCGFYLGKLTAGTSLPAAEPAAEHPRPRRRRRR